jgi:amino acid adenylation domain-containing protein
VNYPGNKTTSDLFEEQAKKIPGKAALVYDNSHLTYKELDHKANRLSNHLGTRGLLPDTIAGVMLEPSLEMIVALLGIMKAGGAYLPIDSRYPPARVQYILGDSKTGILITRGDFRDYFKEVKFEGDIINIFDNGLYAGNSHSLENSTTPGSLAYVMYTSGSTGKPKGVMVEQKNVVRLVRNSNYLDFADTGRLLMTGVLVFDVTTFEIWGPLSNGLTLFPVDQAVLLDAGQLGEILKKNAISILHLIPQLFNHLAVKHPGIFKLLEYLLVGGDIVKPEYIYKVKNRNKNLKILHMYGPTENTTFSTYLPVENNYNSALPIGKPTSNSTVYIVDKNVKLQPVGIAGELCTGGKGVARGYMNRPELTAEKFIKNPFISLTGNDRYSMFNDRLYRTGDMGRWLPDGNIDFLGRGDTQVKIRGIRIELGEIESQILKYETIDEVVVLIREDKSGDKNLCAYIAGTRDRGDIDAPGLRRYLSRVLPYYMVPSYFVLMDRIPVNTNGKVDRSALPSPEIKAEDDYVAPRDAVEMKLVEIWVGVLGAAPDSIGIDDNFFQLGGHSLKTTILVAKIHKEMNVNIPVTEIFARPVIREAAKYIKAAEKKKYTAINPGELKEYYPLSPAQRRFYFLQQMDLNSTAHNILLVFEPGEAPEREKMEEALSRLIKRHESLRTSYAIINREPVQQLHENVDFKIGYFPFRSPHEVEETIRNFVRPFNLYKAPLLRVGLMEAKPGHFILMVDIHHIISDGFSQQVLVKDFMSLYNNEKLPGLRIQYKDYAIWKSKEKENESFKQQEKYWLNQFQGELPLLKIPTDYKRVGEHNFEGNRLNFEFEIGSGQTKQLKRIALQSGSTLFVVLLAAFEVLLSKITGQEDIIVGTLSAGRGHADLENIIGVFINTLVLRSFPRKEKKFSEFLKEVKEKTLEAFKNQDFPFDELVEKVVEKRHLGRNPLFDVMFDLEYIDEFPRRRFPPKQLPNLYENKTAKFDFIFIAVLVGERIKLDIEYSTKLFKKDTIKSFLKYYLRIVKVLTENLEITIKNIGLIEEKEKERIYSNLQKDKKERNIQFNI